MPHRTPISAAASKLAFSQGVIAFMKSAIIAASIAVLLLTFALPFAPQPSFAAPLTAPTVLHTFTGGKDGSYPDSNLTADAAGNLYGTTQIGGADGAGTVFELSPGPNDKWQFSVIYTFTGGTDGGNPLGSLVFDAAGNAYST